MNILRGISCGILAASSLAVVAQQPAAAPVPPTTSPAAEPTQPSAPLTTTPAAPPIPVSSAPTGSPSTAGVDNSRYIIGAEDSIQITVWREPTLSGTFPVRPDGMISMVLVGDLPAAGMTPTALGTDISQRLHKYIQDPSVTVQVMAVNSQRVYLIGEIGHVGPIPLTAGMSPLQAIAAAGGPSPFAKTKKIYILRGSGKTPEKIPFNYKEALKGDNKQLIVLKPGDTIVVP